MQVRAAVHDQEALQADGLASKLSSSLMHVQESLAAITGAAQFPTAHMLQDRHSCAGAALRSAKLHHKAAVNAAAVRDALALAETRADEGRLHDLKADELEARAVLLQSAELIPEAAEALAQVRMQRDT